jgi:hypothetical protein
MTAYTTAAGTSMWWASFSSGWTESDLYPDTVTGAADASPLINDRSAGWPWTSSRVSKYRYAHEPCHPAKAR